MNLNNMKGLQEICVDALKEHELSFEVEDDGRICIKHFVLIPQIGDVEPAPVYVVIDDTKYTIFIDFHCAIVPKEKMNSIREFILRVNECQLVAKLELRNDMTIIVRASNELSGTYNEADVKGKILGDFDAVLDLYSPCIIPVEKILSGEMNVDSAFHSFKNPLEETL